MDETTLKLAVRQHYAEAAQTGSCCSSSDCCTSSSPLIDYGELAASLPQGADLGLGCGTPTRFAGIQPGETVLDLGSGAGIDVFLAAQAVGPQGRAIGVDMTPEMIAKARQNASKGGYTNVEFRLGEIERLPIETASVDVVLSNCVINLVPDKRQVFSEIYRALKPGGRFVVSDIVVNAPMDAAARDNLALWAGCVSGAEEINAYLEIVRGAGFTALKTHHLGDYGEEIAPGIRPASLTLEARKL
jgi:SAM-dependent methyltransferase